MPDSEENHENDHIHQVNKIKQYINSKNIDNKFLIVDTLEIFKISENDINGGSYRFYCRKLKSGSINLPKENVRKMMNGFIKRVKKENQMKTI